MESRNKVIIAILVIAVIVAGVMATYYGIGARNTDAKIADLENKLDEANNNLATTKAELAKSNTKINDVKEALGASEETTTTNTTKTNEYKTPYVDFSNGKCLNAESENNIYYPTRSFHFLSAISASIDENGKKVTITTNGDSIKSTFQVDNVGYNNYVVDNFSKKVVNVYIYGMGHSTGNEYILYLMEDGTVEYTKVLDSLKSNSFKSLGKIDGVSNITEVVSGNATYIEPGQDGGPGWRSIYGITSTGDYYDLGAILNK